MSEQLSEWRMTVVRYASGWSWSMGRVRGMTAYSGWTWTKRGAQRKMRRLARRIRREELSKQVWTEKI